MFNIFKKKKQEEVKEQQVHHYLKVMFTPASKLEGKIWNTAAIENTTAKEEFKGILHWFQEETSPTFLLEFTDEAICLVRETIQVIVVKTA